jgi:hypothetical protein
MSTDRNPDRIVRAWLDLMPDEAPDRAIESVLQAVEMTPQARRPLVRGRWRFPAMNRFLAIAAVVVLGTAALGGALLVGGQRGDAVPTAPAVVATASPATSTFGGDLPAAHWVGAPRDVPGLGVSTRTQLIFDSAGVFSLAGTEYGLSGRMLSQAVSDGTTLTFTSTHEGSGCRAGDVGRYGFAISPGGSVLTVRAGEDDCASRAVAAPGTWYRVVCTNEADGCLGELEAGTYPSQYIEPRLPTGGRWAPRFGALTYTVPGGWSNSTDWPKSLSLTPTVDYRTEDAAGPKDGNLHEIFLFTQPRAAVQDASCASTMDTTVGTSVDELLGWLRRRPAIAMTTSTPITIDGKDGLMVDVQLSDSWTDRCPGDPEPSALLFTQEGDREDGYTLGIVGNERMRLILLDLGDGNVLGIAIDSSDPDRFNDLVTQATPIVESLRIP